MYTEKEAKEKWCPVSTGPDGNRQQSYDHVYFDEKFRCIGSECMWWVEDEWLKTPIKDQSGHFINEPCGHCGAIGSYGAAK